MRILKYVLLFILGMTFSGGTFAAVGVADSILICRAKQCTKLEKVMTKSYIFNYFVDFFENNLNQDILLCDADPVYHVCYDHQISIPVVAGVAKTTLKLPLIRLIDANLAKNQTRLNLLLDYTFLMDGKIVPCKTSSSQLIVDSPRSISISSPAFGCDITETGKNSVNLQFVIDYIDFDYGTLGGFYTIGFAENTQGERQGYLLWRFTKEQPSTVNTLDLFGQGMTGEKEEDTVSINENETQTEAATEKVREEETTAKTNPMPVQPSPVTDAPVFMPEVVVEVAEEVKPPVQEEELPAWNLNAVPLPTKPTETAVQPATQKVPDLNAPTYPKVSIELNGITSMVPSIAEPVR